jgi:hypothetical protein
MIITPPGGIRFNLFTRFQFPQTHDKLDGINFRRLLTSLSSTDWKTWDKGRVIASLFLRSVFL